MSAPTRDGWDPAQYERFRRQRQEPFFDLVAMLRAPVDAVQSVVDLGCGTGDLTALLAARFPSAAVLGVDSSPAMLARATAAPTSTATSTATAAATTAAGGGAPVGPRVSFRRQDIADFDEARDFDLVFSNAALHWVPDHERLLPRLLDALAPGAEIAVQVPANDHHPSHVVADEVAASAPFASLLGGWVRRSAVLPAERYAELLYRHDLRDAVCLEKIYSHELPDTDAVVEWVKGTTLTAYLGRLDVAAADAYLAAYRRRLREVLGAQSPFFYPFRRLLFRGRKGA